MSNYPEHDKLHGLVHISQPLGEFLDWLKSSGREIGHWTRHSGARERIVRDDNGEESYVSVYEERFEPYPRSVQHWLADFFDIDLAKIDKEKEAMLNDARNPPAQGT